MPASSASTPARGRRDAVRDALLLALQRWPFKGRPDQPRRVADPVAKEPAARPPAARETLAAAGAEQQRPRQLCLRNGGRPVRQASCATTLLRVRVLPPGAAGSRQVAPPRPAPASRCQGRPRVPGPAEAMAPAAGARAAAQRNVALEARQQPPSSRPPRALPDVQQGYALAGRPWSARTCAAASASPSCRAPTGDALCALLLFGLGACARRRGGRARCFFAEQDPGLGISRWWRAGI